MWKYTDNKNLDINTFSVFHSQINGKYGVNGPGCGINYDTNTIYMVGGGTWIESNKTFFANPYYVTLGGLDTTNGYSNIVSSSFVNNELNTSILTSIPGYANNNGLWLCLGDCSTQIGREPYIYIVGSTTYFPDFLTESMLIFDMNTNQYIEPSKYSNIVPGFARAGTNIYCYPI